MSTTKGPSATYVVATLLPPGQTQRLAQRWEKLSISVQTLSSWEVAARLQDDTTLITSQTMLQRCPADILPSIMQRRERLLIVSNRQELSGLFGTASNFLKQASDLMLMGTDAPFIAMPSAQRPGLANHNLTKRELQVLVGMSQGKSNKQIGKERGLAEDTIKTHARRLFGKLGARDRAHAVALGFRRGILR